MLETYREVPPGRLRPARASAAPRRAAAAPHRPRRGRDAERVAVRLLAPLRLRRHVHVRGRHAARRAARAGARARPRPPQGAARPGGASRPHRPRRRSSRWRRSCAARRRAPTRSTTSSCGAATWPPGEFDEALAAALETERRAVRVRLGGDERLIAAEDAGRYRDALGAMPPVRPSGRVPRGRRGSARLDPPALRARARAVHDRRGGPRGSASSPSARRRCSRALDLVRGELRPGGTEREWCDPDVLRRLRRASLARLRKEVEPVEQGALGRFLPGWQGVDRRASLREALVPLQGVSLPVRSGRATCCLAACRATSRRWLDQLTASGRGRLGRARASSALPSTSARTRRRSGDRARCRLPRGRRTRRSARRSRAARSSGSTSCAAPGLEGEAALPALWDLVWAGEVTNDAWQPLAREPPLPGAACREAAAPVLARSARTRSPPRRAAGRYDRRALRRRARSARARRAPARAPGDRHARRRSGRRDSRRLCAGLSRAAASSRRSGVCRRGYFVEGLGGAQFALPRRGRAPARASPTRRPRSSSPPPIPLSRTAPRCPWPKRSGARAARVAGAYVVLLGGEPALFVERGGRSLVPLRDPEDGWLRTALAALVEHARRTGLKRLAVERFDGEPVGETDAMPLLVEAGFLAGPRRAVLRA